MPDLVAEWKPILQTLGAVSAAFGNKPVTFTELGYPSGTGLRGDRPNATDYALQATQVAWLLCVEMLFIGSVAQYEAVFQATSQLPWFLG